MNKKAKTYLSLGMFFVVFGLSVISSFSKSTNFKIVFCDIGQGDGILIVTESGKQVVIDGGPGSQMTDCLSNHMPFWDRTIEMMSPTHFQKDHMEAQVDIFNKFNVENVITTKVLGTSRLAKEWNESLEVEGSSVHVPKAGEKIVVDDLVFEVLWPTNLAIAEWKELVPADLNETSIVLRLVWQSRHGEKCAYFTGDIPKEILETVIDKPCELLKIAHHGSKTGTSDLVLEKIRPKLAVIQVGKNSYGHPTREVLDLLSKHSAKVLRNDQERTIEIDKDLQVISDK